MGIYQSWQKSAVMTLDDFCVRCLQRSFYPADFAIFYQHAAMLEYVLAIEYSHVMDQLRLRASLNG